MAASDLDGVRQKYERERAKRATPDRNEILDLVGPLARYRHDLHTPPTVREPVVDVVDAVVVGGGFGGLLCGARLREGHLNRVRIIDQAGDFGGVWYWNRYPGAQCDVESYVYMPLLEELGTIPTEKYAHGPELRAHAQAVGRHFGLYDLALFHTTVSRATWNDERAMWEIRTDRDDRIWAHYLVLAIGSLDKLKLPALPGLETFAGHSFHTSRWDYSYTGGKETNRLTGLQDKTVGIVGTGATALQCVPHLGEWSRELFVFQRTPSTVAPRNNRPTDPAWAASLEPGWQARRIRNFTTIVTGGPADVDLVDDSWTDIYKTLLNPPPLGREVSQSELVEWADLEMMERIRRRIDSIVTDPETAGALKPYYRYLCKRPGFHDSYLKTFNRPTVHLVDTAGAGIDRIIPEGVVANGQVHKLDCLIWATGFEWNTAYSERIGFEVFGAGGLSLRAKWAHGVRTMHGLMTSGFPNFFALPGPNTQSVVTHNFVHILNENAEHLRYIVRAVGDRGARGFTLSDRGEDEWVSTIIACARYEDEFFRSCTPSRFNNEGNLDARPRVNTNFGEGPDAFFDILAKWRDEQQLAGLSLLY
jgi:cyclohexanone monooxygenase